MIHFRLPAAPSSSRSTGACSLAADSANLLPLFFFLGLAHRHSQGPTGSIPPSRTRLAAHERPSFSKCFSPLPIRVCAHCRGFFGCCNPFVLPIMLGS